MSKDLRKSVETEYFSPIPSDINIKGTRDLNPLFPFIISGGEKTEHWYFKHITIVTNYKFNVFPEYFGNESNYAVEFPQRIDNIKKNNPDALIYCVFDFDAIRRNGKTELDKFKQFSEKYVHNDSVIICHSMPSIEYWFLLHFENYTKLLKSCGPKSKIQKMLSKHMLSFFPKSDKKLCNILKDEDYVENPTWVANLCADGKLELAITRAEENIKKAIKANDLNNQSFSFVYRIFKEYNKKTL